MNQAGTPPSDTLLARLAPEVLQLVLDAGEAIMRVYTSDFAITHKADKSPLTQADLAAHRVLASGLTALEPRFPVLSEEAQVAGFDERRTWSTYWLIDPLDGTREFVKRNDEFTVNVALVHDHQPVLGVVHAPALALTYVAHRGGVAWRARDGAREPIRVAPRVREPVRVAGSRSHAGDSLKRFLAALGAHEMVSMGSSLKLCLVADGSVDVYPRLGPTSEWDTAAAHCVVEQAGGQVTDTRLQPLRYNTKESLLNPKFLVFADAARDWRACLSA